MDKFNSFLINSKELKDKYGFIPLLYGSLGLEVLTNNSLDSDDIDILIPEKYIKEELWIEFKEYLENKGYQLIDEHEHTFIKDDIKFSYASIENLDEFAGIKVEDINKYTENEIEYLLLDLPQYLKVYERSSLDGYRINHKEKQDYKKIEFIKHMMDM